MSCRRFRTAAAGLEAVVGALDRSPESVAPEIHRTVETILGAVRERGDAALLEFTERFDGVKLQAAELRVTTEELTQARHAVGADVLRALRYAAERIEAFHRRTLPRSWWVEDEHGSLLGQQVRPLDRVGIYAPGGRAPYPSTVLMTAIPARVAGVRELVLVSPPAADKSLHPAVLAAADLSGVREIYRVGGAQAIAALAFGTETILPVAKIVGPGNIYVALAKQYVVGQVEIDMVAGPSEVLVVADDSANPEWVAADLLAQAEHDPMARAVLLTPSAALIERVGAALERQLKSLPRREIARQALEANGALVLTHDLEEAISLANRLAPEHLELQVEDPFGWLPRVRHAGAIFLGCYTPEVLGDYVAGPSHVLPTGGTARVASGLGVEDFVKRSSLIRYSSRGLEEAWANLSVLAEVEGLHAHREAARLRLGRERTTP